MRVMYLQAPYIYRCMVSTSAISTTSLLIYYYNNNIVAAMISLCPLKEADVPEIRLEVLVVLIGQREHGESGRTAVDDL